MGDDRRLVAVAGATGNAGKQIVRALSDRGARVRALVRNPERLGEAHSLCHEIRIVQVTDPASLRGTLDGAVYFVSAIGKTRQKDRIPRRKVDVDANLNLFAEAKRARVQRVALISVAWASPDHPVSMLRMKAEAEQGLKQSGIPYVIIQPSGFFSDMWEVFQMCRKGTFYCIGDGKLRFNPISLEDLGDFVAESLFDDSKLGRSLPVGGPEVFDTNQLVKVCEGILGKKVKIRRIPLWLAKTVVAAIRPFSGNLWELSQFFVGTTEHGIKRGNDAVVPSYGTRRLEDYLRQRYEAES